MTARHATPYFAVETNQVGGAHELILRDWSGLVRDEIIIEGRPSAISHNRTVLTLETDTGISTMHLTPVQLRAIAALATILADEAEAAG
jgi:hypothetical protein